MLIVVYKLAGQSSVYTVQYMCSQYILYVDGAVCVLTVQSIG